MNTIPEVSRETVSGISHPQVAELFGRKEEILALLGIGAAVTIAGASGDVRSMTEELFHLEEEARRIRKEQVGE